MRLVQIRAANQEEMDCLLRELVDYMPRQTQRTVLVVCGPAERGWVKVKNRGYWRYECERESTMNKRRVRSSSSDPAGGGNASHTRSVRLKIDGQSYVLAGQ